MILSDVILASMPLQMREQLKADIMAGRTSDADPRLQNVPQVFGLLSPDRCETVEDALYMAVGMNSLTVIALRSPADAKKWESRAKLACPAISNEAAARIGRICDSPDVITGFVDKSQEVFKKILNTLSFGITNLTPDQSFDADKPYEICEFGKQICIVGKRFRMNTAGMESLLTGFKPGGSGDPMGDPDGDPEMALAQAYDYALGAQTGPLKLEEVGGPFMTFISGQRGINKGKNEMMKNVYARLQTVLSDPEFVKNLFSSVSTAASAGIPAVSAVESKRMDQSHNDVGDPVIPDMTPLSYAEVGDAFGTLMELNDIISGDPEIGGPLMKRLRAKKKLRQYLATQRALAKVRAKHKRQSDRAGLEDADFDTTQTFGSKHGRFQADALEDSESSGDEGGSEEEFDGSSSSSGEQY